MVKVDIGPIINGVTTRALPGPVTIRGNMAAGAVVVIAGVVEVDIIPVGRVVAGRARVQIVHVRCNVAQGAVSRQQDVIHTDHRPRRGAVAVGAGIWIVPVGGSVAGDAGGSGIVDKANVVPTGGVVAGGAFPNVVRLGYRVAVYADAISGVVKVNPIYPGHDTMAVRAQPRIVGVRGIFCMAVQTFIGIDVIVTQGSRPTPRNMAA